MSATVQELTNLLAKEKITAKFYQESERAALKALESIAQELKAVKSDLEVRAALQSKLQQDLRIAAANNDSLQQQTLLLQTELGERVKELTALRIDAEETRKRLEKDVAAARKEKRAVEDEVALLKSQVTILSDCVKGGAHGVFVAASQPPDGALATPGAASSNSSPFVDALAQQYDAHKWKAKADLLADELKTANKELEHVRFLWKDERMEAQRANILLVCHQRLVEHLAAAPQRAMLCTKEEEAHLLALQDAVALMTASQVADIMKDNAAFRASVDRLQEELLAANRLASERASDVAALKKKYAEAKKQAEAAATQLREKRTQDVLDQQDRRKKMLEQGSVASILMTFFSAPARCPHCRGGLSDTLGLELLAEACDCSSVEELVDLMVHAVSDRVSAAYREAYLDQVTVVSPATNIAMASQLVGPVPKGLMFFPTAHFATFLERTRFISEAQAYALAIQFMTTGARFLPTQAAVDDILDKVRFLYLSAPLVESEISRIEQQVVSHGSSVMPQSSHHALLLSRNLLARLTQSLRVKATAFQWKATHELEVHSRSSHPTGGAGAPSSTHHPNAGYSVPPAFEDPAHPVVLELRRMRGSYAFLPQSLRAVLETKGELKALQELPVAALLELQPYCV